VTTGVHAIGAAILGAIQDSRGTNPEVWASLILGIGSYRSMMLNGIAAEVFLAAFDRMPSIRQAMERTAGALGVGAALGIVMWFVMDVLWPVPPGAMRAGLTTVVLLTYALFVGPSIVWVVAQHTPSPVPSLTLSREKGRRIASGLAVMFPAPYVLLWTKYTEAGRNAMMAGGVIYLFILALTGVGSLIILSGLLKRGGTVGASRSSQFSHVRPLSAPVRVTPRVVDDSMETWTRPVLIAGILGGIAGCVGSALVYTNYLRWLFRTKPAWMWSKGQLPPIASFFTMREFVIALGFAILLALLCRARPAVRQRFLSTEGLVTITLVLGAAIWVLTRSFAVRPLVEEPALSILGLLIDVACVAPAIVVSFRLFGTAAKART